MTPARQARHSSGERLGRLRVGGSRQQRQARDRARRGAGSRRVARDRRSRAQRPPRRPAADRRKGRCRDPGARLPPRSLGLAPRPGPRSLASPSSSPRAATSSCAASTAAIARRARAARPERLSARDPAPTARSMPTALAARLDALDARAYDYAVVVATEDAAGAGRHRPRGPARHRGDDAGLRSAGLGAQAVHRHRQYRRRAGPRHR